MVRVSNPQCEEFLQKQLSETSNDILINSEHVLSTSKSTDPTHLSRVPGNSLVVQWLGPCAFTVKGLGLIPGQETDSESHWSGKKKKSPLCKAQRIL